MKSLVSAPAKGCPQYHRNAYYFVFSALQHSQERLCKSAAHVLSEDEAHITGAELCEGFRELALRKFGLMAHTVMRTWGIHSTEDIGRVVFELIERGEMRKTERDTLDDFENLYEFADVFEQQWRLDPQKAFRNLG